MDFLSCILSVLFAWALVRALRKLSRGSKAASGRLPPGPVPWPVVGNLLKLGNKPHKSLAELAKSYGPIMCLKLGHMTTIVISTPTVAKEVLQKQDVAFSNRTTPDAVRAHGHDLYSMAWLPVSTRWRTLRKISNSHIFTSQRLDENHHLRRRKLDELLARVAESSLVGAVVDMGAVAFLTSLNLLSNTVFSKDLVEPGLGAVQETKEVVWGMMEEAGRPNLVDYFPVLRRLDPQGIRRRMTGYFGKMLEVFGDIIDERLEWRKQQSDGDSPAGTTNDVLDVLLNIIEDAEIEEKPNRTDVEHFIVDLFVAGSDTTSSTVEWAMTELLRKPETLERARSELHETIGPKNLVQEADMPRLPYLQAVVKETFRLHPPVPLLLPRTAEKDAELCGFTVPAGAQIMVNAWAIGRDPGTWEDPESFLPERFLGSDVDVKGRSFELIPFGGGRRICPGLPLAIRMVHLMLGSLIHGFRWKVADDGMGSPETAMDMDEKFGITLQKAKSLCAVPIRG
uniref:Santalene/bergamotene oxidase n=1 Tax=Santalum album TaxID=35974 RepID=V5REU4_SANAL|nr:santalene/bergamotene oxidase [Santalum album]